MLKLLLFSGTAAVLLGSAIPPAEGRLLRPAPPRLRIDWAGLAQDPAPACSVRPIAGCVADQPIALAASGRAGTAGNPAPSSAAAPPFGADDGGSIRVVVSIPQQKAYVFRDGALAWTSKVSTGKRGHETPLGTFTISQKAVRHRSNLYSNAPMPYMQRLTSGGVALHAGHVPGYRASHGCIRLPWSYAKKLYAMTRSGTKVHVTNQRPRSAKEALHLT